MTNPRPTPRPLSLLLLLSLCLAAGPACSPDSERVLEVLELDSGVRIEVLERGQGEPASEGGYVQVGYQAFLEDGTPLGGPVEDEPFLIRLVPGDPSAIEGLRQAAGLLAEGAKARVTVPPAMAYGDIGKGQIPPGATLRYELELVQVFTRSDSGLQYVILDPGEGPTVGDGDQVVVDYRGWLLQTGREFASSRQRNRPEEFRLGEGRGLPGWEEALRLLGRGGRCLIALPPELGYGAKGRLPAIPPGYELIYELHLLGVRS